MEKAPKSMRLHIGIFGRRNVGKSSLINAITNQSISIVSEVAGTTTDAVEKSMEMLPLGPVTLIDTAGIDDVGDLGEQRVQKSEQIIERTDVALIVCDFDGWTEFEKNLAKLDENFLAVNREIARTVKRISDIAEKNKDLNELMDKYNIGTMSIEESCIYIKTELSNAGASSDIFTPQALRAIASYSSGNPRVISRVCDLALMIANKIDKSNIDEEVANLAINEINM